MSNTENPAPRSKTDGLPQDVINLVIAAREFWELVMDDSDESAALDAALEAFSSRVPYDNEPDVIPSPSPQTVGTMDCPCTTFEQDEDCPVGYPSLLCHACDGKGIAPIDKVVAFAAEMMKVAEQVDELEDPFAAWETIDLIKSQHGQMRKALTDARALLTADFGADGRVIGVSHEMDGLRRMVALLDAALTTEGQPDA